MPRTSSRTVDAIVVDGASLFDVTETLSARLNRKVALDYKRLREELDGVRQAAGWRQSTLRTIFLSVDLESEGQSRFRTMVEKAGFEAESVYFRNTHVSLPVGRVSEVAGKPIASFSSKLSYIAGLQARHPGAHFLVVTHAFDVADALSDLAARFKIEGKGGRVGLAFFASLLDPRWKSAGLLDGGLGVEFFDLDPVSQPLLGVDLVERATEPRTGSILTKF